MILTNLTTGDEGLDIQPCLHSLN